MITRLITVVLMFASTALLAQDRPPVLIAEINGNEVPMLLTKLDSKVRIAGRLAETSLTMTFYNKNKRQLSGTLYFPLPEEATVSGYGLDIKGKMIDGVIVSKAAGRRIFEKIVRQNTDPGLVEWTRGNTFKTRVFPIPANGERTVKVVYVSELSSIDNTFKLPMNFKDPIKSFKLDISVLDPHSNPKLKSGGEFKKAFGIWNCQIIHENKAVKEDIIVEIPKLNGRKYFVEKASDGNYYYVIYDNPESQKPLAENIQAVNVIWDFSLSRYGKHEKEIELLRTYLNSLPGTARVNLIGFSNSALSLGKFTASQADEITGKIKEQKYDGGTHFKSLQHTLKHTPKSDLILLFSDGIANWGERQLNTKAPVYTFSADHSTEASFLKYLALNSGGLWFNLKTMPISKVVPAIGKKTFMFQGAQGGVAGSSYPKIPQPVSGTVIVTGKIDGNMNKVKLAYGFPGSNSETREFTINTHDAFESDLLRRYWAQRKLANLLLEEQEMKDEIEALGREHHLVTPFTSLIVLESIDQYIEHEVRPPKNMPEWVKAFDKRMEEIAAREQNDEKKQIKDLTKIWTRRVKHFNKEFKYPENFKYLPEKTKKTPALSEGLAPANGDRDADGLSDPFGAPAADAAAENSPGARPIRQAAGGANDLVGGIADVESFEDGHVQNFDAIGRLGRSTRGLPDFKRLGNSNGRSGSISIKKWDPKTPYIAAMKAADDKYASYLEQREKYIKSPAFFFDCAAFFYNERDRVLGEKVLSNIVELDLENAALLRIIAYRLIEEKSFDLAIKILKDVIKIREEEPQSYRDLALAMAGKADLLAARKLNEDAKVLYGEALKNLEKVIKSHWDRFDEIEIIALNEYNRICSRAGLTHFDEKLNKVLSDDVRIVLSWDADQTDIDLWVIEPSGEKVFYSHNRSTIGGRMSRDFTNGYGPEEYTLRKAMKGKYQIKANFYGSRLMEATGGVTVKVDVYTNYGTPNEKHQVFSVKLKSKKDVIKLGEIEF